MRQMLHALDWLGFTPEGMCVTCTLVVGVAYLIGQIAK